MSDSLGLSPQLVQAYIDSFLGSTLLQTLLTGVYLVIFWNAVVPLVKSGKQKIYTGVLFLQFAMVIFALAAQWKITRSIYVVHDQTRDTIELELLTGSVSISLAQNAIQCIAVVIADSLLCWRCYTLWRKNKWMLGVVIIMLLGEVALIPMFILLQVRVGPEQVSIICIFFFISTGITVIATALITYRIVDVSRHTTGQRITSYQYIVEILVESGVIYSTTLLITGILLAVGGNIDVANHSPAIVEAAAWWGGILTPVTGIAPTLIALRISNGSARDEKQWSQPTNALSFRRPPAVKDVLLSTLNAPSVTVTKFETTATDIESRGKLSYTKTVAEY